MQGCARRGCVHGGAHTGVVGTLSQSDYRWGHSANQITGGDTQPIRLQVRAGGARAGDACTGGAYAGDVCTGGAHAGVVGTLSQSDYRWGHSANQITGGDTQPMRLQVRAGGVCAGGACTGGVRAGGA